MLWLRALFVGIVLLTTMFAPLYGRWPEIALEDAALAAANDPGATAGSPDFYIVASSRDDNDNEEVQTGSGRDAEDLGSSNGVVNPGAEDLGVKHGDDNDD
jgi:hypothetical protein